MAEVSKVLLVVVLLCGGVHLSAQRDVDNVTLNEVELDTTFTDGPPPVRSKGEGMLSVFYGKPGRAAFYGLIIPGGGQAYNRKYWKVPLALALDGFAFYNLYDSNRQYNRWNEGLQMFNDGEITSFGRFTTAREIKAQRDIYRSQRENGILLAIGAHLFTFMEAYIDRHLTDFDISDDLTVGYSRGGVSNTMALGVFVTLR